MKPLNVEKFVADALIASLVASPRQPGLSFAEIKGLGAKKGFRPGEIGDALGEYGIRQSAPDKVIFELPEVDFFNLGMWEVDYVPEFRNLDALKFIFNFFYDQLREYGKAHIGIARDELLAAGAREYIDPHDLDVAISLQATAGTLSISDEFVKPRYMPEKRDFSKRDRPMDITSSVLDLLPHVQSIIAARRAGSAPVATPPRLDAQQRTAAMKLFISHSGEDHEIAASFIDLLRSALNLPGKDIRCASVGGYKLPAGTNADDQLRQEVFDSEVFVALLSPTSILSTSVMFELGARWGTRKYLAPVLVRGLAAKSLCAPLSAIHAVHGTDAPDMHQLLADLGKRLSMSVESPSVYDVALGKFVTAAGVII